MSLNYTDITAIIYEDVGANSTSYPAARLVSDVNLGIDNLMLMLWGEDAGGAWQMDDSNHTGYPILTTNLVANQRDYTFITDGAGNIILDIYKVMAKNDTNGIFQTLEAVNMRGDDAPETLNDGQNLTGVPTKYGKTGNSVFLDLIPSYSSTGGLKIFINREASYFTSSDTTKKWGFTGLYHEYLVLYANYRYARRKNLANRDVFKRDLLEMEEKIRKHAGVRQKDAKRQMFAKVEDNR